MSGDMDGGMAVYLLGGFCGNAPVRGNRFVRNFVLVCENVYA